VDRPMRFLLTMRRDFAVLLRSLLRHYQFAERQII